MQGFAIDRYGTVDELRWREDLDAPAAGPRDVLVRVQASALNPSELKVLAGRISARFIHASRFPLVLGYDFSGTVEACGAEVADLSVGDEVFGFLPYTRSTRQGTFCERVVARAGHVAPKPAKVSHEAAACAATAGVTALQALRDLGRLRAGQRVLVNGASGGVGCYAVQIGGMLGAEVWGTCSAEKMAFVEQLGAARAVDYRQTPLRRLGTTFDVVLDVATTSSFAECRPILAPGGTYVTLLPSVGLVTGMLLSVFTSRRCRMIAVKADRADLAQLGEWLETGRIESPIDRTYALSEIPQAMQCLASGAVRGKVAVRHEAA